MGPRLYDVGNHMIGRGVSSLIKVDTVCSQMMFTAEENERRLVAFRRSCHLVERVTFGGGSDIWWRERHLMEGASFGGGSAICWMECHLVDGVSFGGGSVMV